MASSAPHCAVPGCDVADVPFAGFDFGFTFSGCRWVDCLQRPSKQSPIPALVACPGRCKGPPGNDARPDLGGAGPAAGCESGRRGGARRHGGCGRRGRRRWRRRRRLRSRRRRRRVRGHGALQSPLLPSRSLSPVPLRCSLALHVECIGSDDQLNCPAALRQLAKAGRATCSSSAGWLGAPVSCRAGNPQSSLRVICTLHCQLAIGSD